MPALLRCCACAGPRVVHEDAHLACVWKPSGVSLRDAPRGGGGGPNRVAPPLETWALRGGVSASREPDAQPPRVASAAERSVGGLVLLSKTARAAEALSRPAALRCAYVAVVAPQHAAGEAPALPPGAAFLEAPTAPGRLALLRVEADAARRPLADVAAALAAAGLPVLGVPASAGVAGGAHLALVQLRLPESLAALRGPDAPTAFAADTPAKFAKALRRDALRGERLLAQDAQHEAAAAADDDGGGACVPFMGLQLRVGGEQLRPRASSAAVVHAALAGLAAAGGADAPRVLDLGTGCGALLLATLAALPAAATGCGVDLDADALRYARANAAAALGAAAAERRVALLRADFGRLHAPAVRAALAPGGYHALLCNPPYLRDAAGGDGRVTPEARAALYAGPDGDAAYAALAASLAAAQPPLLAPGGVIALQLPGAAGAARVAGIAAHFARAGFRVAKEVRDQRGVLRCLLLTQHAAAQ